MLVMETGGGNSLKEIKIAGPHLPSLFLRLQNHWPPERIEHAERHTIECDPMPGKYLRCVRRFRKTVYEE